MDAYYVSFSQIVNNYGLQNHEVIDRNNMQIAGQRMINSIGAEGMLRYAVKDIPSNTSVVVFDGIRHLDMYNAIMDMFESTKLVYVDASENERYRRYIIREKQKISQKEFHDICSMEVEREIKRLKNTADYIVYSKKENDIETGIQVTCDILSIMITGKVANNNN